MLAALHLISLHRPISVSGLPVKEMGYVRGWSYSNCGLGRTSLQHVFGVAILALKSFACLRLVCIVGFGFAQV
jgi:hypothetical protein